jgi:hypothetical protein
MAKHSHKINSEMIKNVLNYVENGNFVSTACKAVGISSSAWTQLCQRNPEVKEATEKAYAQAEANAVRRICEEGHRDPKYLQWFLERRNPTHWAGVHKHQLDNLQKEIQNLKDIIAQLSGNT